MSAHADPASDHDVDVLVVGGGLGGVAAAHAAARRGRTVLLAEETDWLGGQLTVQGVPLDEHPWIEQFGCTAAYRSLRDGIRDAYRRWRPLTGRARADRHLNPGAAFVSSLSCEPRVAVAVLAGLLAPHRAAGRLSVLLGWRPVGAEASRDRVEAVTLADAAGDETTVTARYVCDATETGELLPLADVEHVTGAESRAETSEPHAPDEADPRNQQAVTHCVALDHRPGEDHTIARPPDYDAWADQRLPGWPGPQLGVVAPDPKTGEPVTHRLTPNPDDDPADVHVDLRAEGGADELWRFRRLLARRQFLPGAFPSDVTLVNWPMADYTGGPLVGVDPSEAAFHAAQARRLSASLVYWLQTAAPRPDGGTGYPGLRLRGDVLGTADGFAKRAYVRESRRIRAVRTVVEQEVAAGPHAVGPATATDSVGVGCYRIDLHPSTGGDGYLDLAARPFEIPLGTLLPQRVRNLLPAAKNAGTTHITNGCYRLHPVEWTVGEVAGLLAGHCLAEQVEPHQVHADERRLAAYQALLDREGVERSWPDVRAY